MPTYREACADDLNAICALGEVVNLLHHEAWPHVFAGPGDPLRHAAHWQKTIAAADGTTFVAVEGDHIVAFVTVSVVTDHYSLLQPLPYGRVGSVCVEAAHRGRGIGHALMGLAERWAAARGVGDVRLNVWAFNEGALRLYRELGYEVRSHQLGKWLPPAAAQPGDDAA